MGNNKSPAGTVLAPAKYKQTVDDSTSIDAIRELLKDPSVHVIVFSPGTYELSGSFPSEHIFAIDRSVVLKGESKQTKPVLNIKNTGFNPDTDNTEAGAILVNAAGQRVEFENLIINTNRSLDVIASDYLRLDECEITTKGGPANSAVYLGNYFSETNNVTGEVIIENCTLKAEPGGSTTHFPDGSVRENFNAGIFANFTPANYQVINNDLSGNAGVECYGTNKTVIEKNRIEVKGYINSWVSFGIVVTNKPGTSAKILNNKINMDMPAPIEDPFGLAIKLPDGSAGFGPGNGIGVQHGVAIQVGQMIFDLPAYDVTVTNNEVSGNASFMVWAYRVTGGRIQNNTRPNLNLPWFDYNAQRNPPLVPFDATLLGMPALLPYPVGFVGMDFAEYGLMGWLLKREGWWKPFIFGYVPACEYCLMYSTQVELLDNKEPVARFFDFNGTIDPDTFMVTRIPTTNNVLGTLSKVINTTTAIGSPNQAAILQGLKQGIKLP